MRIGFLVALILALVLAGCSAPVSTTTPITPTQEPPLDKTWVLPGKVMISNFHTGARVDSQPITIHNGDSASTTFSVIARVADYTASGYMKVPSDVLQDWVSISDCTPVLGKYETKDISVVLEMPNKPNPKQIQFLQITDVGIKYLSSLYEQAYRAVKDEATRQVFEKYRGHERDVLPDMIDELVTPTKVREELLKNSDAPLLLYMSEVSSVSYEDFEGWSDEMIQRFVESGWIQRGDLTKDNWEFWISVLDLSQTGMVTTEIASRWLVSMRK